MSFQLWPAIDVLGGRVVRLRQGDYDAITTYDTPVETLLDTVASFADGLHVVNLDGARDGDAEPGSLLKRLLAESPVPVEIGGGLRTMGALAEAFEQGAARVIIGSRAVEDAAFVREAVGHFGADRVVVGVDLKDGRPATRGWTETADLSADQLLESLSDDDVETVIVTDVQTDGMMQGPNHALIRRLVESFPELEIIASGGVAAVDDLAALRDTGAAGAVFGRAWLDGVLTPDALRAFREVA
ncbi:MAG: 1-(5-phosphoribosyl)-5-((5-phosphoribosylamino)methylideneamino)imidazole-4-carboxamide isomerase [Rhodothermaceae bacterium]|nr:1-(5-phosphoribosyl)-5-((5-phosphoribosylamino)methylideneamino)imidazole-4-carboxamide isomerase [Rhodothermaceae bacterium]